jgi:hypothetical protein
MKIFTIIFGLLWLGVAAMAEDTNLVQIDSFRIRAIALESIAAKYPALHTSELVFVSIGYSLAADGAEAIEVTYTLPASTEAKEESTSEGQKITTRTEVVCVSLANSGKVRNVGKGSSVSVSSKAK